MGKLKNWMSKAIQSLVDPDRETRVSELVSAMHRGLRQHGQNMSLASVIQGLEFNERDLAIAKDQLYRKILAKGWQDEKLDHEEQRVAQWVANALEIPSEDARRIGLEFAVDYFSKALADAMEDGVLDEREETRLVAIAASVGMQMSEFTRSYFRVAGERFLRAIFMACVADGHVSLGEWEYLLVTTRKFGIERAELLRVIQPQAQQFVEHVLVDAKADGRMSPEEYTTLNWLAQNLGLSPEFRRYLDNEVALLKTLTDIADGQLPSIRPPSGTEIRAGEIVHVAFPALWREVRMLKNGPTVREHRGFVTLTDNRLLFSSTTKSQSIRYQRMLSHGGNSSRIEILVENKPSLVFILVESSPIPYAVLRTAVAMANQTMTARLDGPNTRHIPREVRQRVWQCYGGRCAECGASDYLEYDHIIPVAKGGGNSDNNVQLLCRRCNLKKSDRI